MSQYFSDLVDHELPMFNIAVDKQSAGVRIGGLGAGFENLLQVTNRVYENKGFGCIKKNEVKQKYAGGANRYTMKSTVDYDGYLVGIGFVAFDAKTTREDCWRPSRPQLHQFLYLYRAQKQLAKNQGRVFFLIEFRRIDDSTGQLRSAARVYLAEDLESIKQSGKYVPEDKDVVGEGIGGILFDYRKKLIDTFSA